MPYATQFQDQAVATIGTAAIRDSLRKGWADFLARPTTAIFLIVVYPLIGLVMYKLAFDQNLLPLLFPIASGFALIGPIAAAGLYQISKRREHGRNVDDGPTSYAVLGGSRLWPTLTVGAILLVIYAVWIAVAQSLYSAIFGDAVAADMSSFLGRILTTSEGWLLIVVGCGFGLVFALIALAVGAISLPAIIDRGIGAGPAIGLSVRAFAANPRTMLTWGVLVAAGLVAGSIPAFLGLMVVLPVFGHATWHLYRHLVPNSG